MLRYIKDKLQGKFNYAKVFISFSESFQLSLFFNACINFGFFLSLSGKTFDPYFDRTKYLLLSFENLLNRQSYKHEGSVLLILQFGNSIAKTAFSFQVQVATKTRAALKGKSVVDKKDRRAKRSLRADQSSWNFN